VSAFGRWFHHSGLNKLHLACCSLPARRHLPATFRAASARFRATAHLLIVRSYSLTIIGAAHTHFGADPASKVMKVGATNHKVCARLANLRAVEHQPDVRGFGVLAAHL